ncbi:hypothetical protein V499_08953, partial [Pseudogymnoascus sp. VKM F-103]
PIAHLTLRHALETRLSDLGRKPESLIATLRAYVAPLADEGGGTALPERRTLSTAHRAIPTAPGSAFAAQRRIPLSQRRIRKAVRSVPKSREGIHAA